MIVLDNEMATVSLCSQADTCRTHRTTTSRSPSTSSSRRPGTSGSPTGTRTRWSTDIFPCRWPWGSRYRRCDSSCQQNTLHTPRYRRCDSSCQQDTLHTLPTCWRPADKNVSFAQLVGLVIFVALPETALASSSHLGLGFRV